MAKDTELYLEQEVIHVTFGHGNIVKCYNKESQADGIAKYKLEFVNSSHNELNKHIAFTAEALTPKEI